MTAIRKPLQALCALAFLGSAFAGPAFGQAATGDAPGSDETTAPAPEQYTLGMQAGLNLVSERHLYWDLSETFAGSADFDPDATWVEWYVKPSMAFDLPRGDWRFFGKLSLVASGTQGTDAYAARDTNDVDLEESHLGVRHTFSETTTLEASIGARELKFGTGMLFSNGGSNGFERGALKLGPRKAWDLASLLQLRAGRHVATLTRLSPNELESADNGNRVVVLDWRRDGGDGAYLGATAARVTRSRSPYPQAVPGNPPRVLPGAREGLEVLDLYARTARYPLGSATFAATGEFALQRNDRVDLDAWGGRVQLELGFPQQRWAPTLTASAQAFSGDDPDTLRLERFDPLFYEGSPSSWATGSKSAMVFINSNLRAYNLALKVTPTQRDTFTLRYAHVRADELRSPLQFGQATRLDFANGSSTIVSGVTDAHLSDDLFLEYMRIASRHVFIGAGISVSVPGAGIRAAVPGDVPHWIGAYANVVINY